MWNTPRRRASPEGKSHNERDTYDLTRLLPSPGPVTTIRFRTLNGFQFEAMAPPPDAKESAPHHIRRIFKIQPPAGELAYCAVDVSPAVRRTLRELTGRDFKPGDPVWDLVCRTSLCARLWDETKLPPEYLPVYQISREQQAAVLALTVADAGFRPP